MGNFDKRGIYKPDFAIVPGKANRSFVYQFQFEEMFLHALALHKERVMSVLQHNDLIKLERLVKEGTL